MCSRVVVVEQVLADGHDEVETEMSAEITYTSSSDTLVSTSRRRIRCRKCRLVFLYAR